MSQLASRRSFLQKVGLASPGAIAARGLLDEFQGKCP